MAEPSTTSRPREASAVEGAARIALRRKTAEQRLRIQERLTMGLTVAHIAQVEQLDGAAGAADHRGDARQPRDRSAPGFVQLQIARLSEAMIVARTIMMQGNLQAMDRWIKLTSELDRYPAFHRPKFAGRGMRRRSRASPRRSPARSRRTEVFPSPGSRREGA
jgi:hypothetical protein